MSFRPVDKKAVCTSCSAGADAATPERLAKVLAAGLRLGRNPPPSIGVVFERIPDIKTCYICRELVRLRDPGDYLGTCTMLVPVNPCITACGTSEAPS